MISAVALIAFLASTTSNEIALEIATPSEVAFAVESCIASARRGGADESHLVVDGWQEQPRSGGAEHVFTHPRNASIVMTLEKIFQDSCIVRARLADDASIKEAGEEIARRIGLQGKRPSRQPEKIFWRTSNRFIAFESFDAAFVIQILIADLPKEFR